MVKMCIRDSGTDGPASGNTLDLFTQMRLCADFHKNENKDRSAMPAKDIVAMATIGGARALGLDRKIGSLEPGKEADLVLVETDSANMFPVYDPYSALVYLSLIHILTETGGTNDRYTKLAADSESTIDVIELSQAMTCLLYTSRCV